MVVKHIIYCKTCAGTEYTASKHSWLLFLFSKNAFSENFLFTNLIRIANKLSLSKIYPSATQFVNELLQECGNSQFVLNV